MKTALIALVAINCLSVSVSAQSYSYILTWNPGKGNGKCEDAPTLGIVSKQSGACPASNANSCTFVNDTIPTLGSDCKTTLDESIFKGTYLKATVGDLSTYASSGVCYSSGATYTVMSCDKNSYTLKTSCTDSACTQGCSTNSGSLGNGMACLNFGIANKPAVLLAFVLAFLALSVV